MVGLGLIGFGRYKVGKGRVKVTGVHQVDLRIRSPNAERAGVEGGAVCRDQGVRARIYLATAQWFTSAPSEGE